MTPCVKGKSSSMLVKIITSHKQTAQSFHSIPAYNVIEFKDKNRSKILKHTVVKY